MFNEFFDGLAGFFTSKSNPKRPGPINENGVPFAIVPEGYDFASLRDLAPAPGDRRATARFDDVESLINYVNAFKDTDSRAMYTLTADSDTPFVATAILDYHRAQVTSQTNVARWGRHRGIFTAKASEPWLLWTGIHGKKLTQSAFAEFIEERAQDFIAPSSADMMTVARDFSSVNEVTFASKIDLHNGARRFHYEDKEKAKGDITCPQTFTVRIPLFVGSDPVEMTVRLRFRVDGSGQLTFTCLLVNMTDTVEFVGRELASKIAEQTGIPVHRGSVTIPDVND